MKTPFLDQLIDEHQNHIESVEVASYAGIPETRKQLAELEGIKKLLLHNVINWVACKDELPEISDWVLCCNTEDDWTDFADIHHNGHGKKVFWNREFEVYPTHWAKLPNPPCL